ncbi:outer membrane efflux protein [Phreatobacter oligotrophus]|uniref:Outer membrane efflux protein n=2 Tax=Phreatobacter oligotrophus TaxID=1122261 RepID=A0A2T4YS34_9HYPH|nr:outer membrane efflux protein [Phreatobacter oligotrophus]
MFRVTLAPLLALLMFTPATARAEILSRHLTQALSIDPVFRTLAAQREAAAARGVTVASPIAGSPVIEGSIRSNTRGPGVSREFEVGGSVPIWLPGQREALGGVVTSSLAEIDQRLRLRRLEVAGAVREAWWQAVRTERDWRLARDRLATARDIQRDQAARITAGTSAPADDLLARGEVAAAEQALREADAAAKASRTAYSVLTAGGIPTGVLERAVPRRNSDDHPATDAARASVARASAQMRLVKATPIENPEIGLFGRTEAGAGGSAETTGIRVRIPLATEARNAPRRAEARAGLTEAEANLAAERRRIDAGIAAAVAARDSARQIAGLARTRLSLANEQLAIARTAFRSGALSALDLFRIQQLQLEAARASAEAATSLGLAESRLNQALGFVPLSHQPGDRVGASPSRT